MTLTRHFIQHRRLIKKIFKRSLEFDHYISGALEFWFGDVSSTVGLGVNFGIIRTVGGVASAVPRGARVVGDDLAALTALCEVRTSDLVPLMRRLEGPIQKPDLDPDMRQSVIS